MANTNVDLSKNELRLVTSTQFILTKNNIIEKVYNMFGLLSEDYKHILNKYAGILPVELFNRSPKIYKGENYLQMPYVMMDYPRMFLKEDVFAIRSFFWWGNFFSVTLHLSGKYSKAFSNSIERNLKNKLNEDYFICISDKQWEHNFEETNYKALTEINSASAFLDRSFIKIARKLPLNEWNSAMSFFEKSYIDLLELMVST